MDINTLAVGLGTIIGLVMGLTGAGGGVLAIPLLVFGLHLPVQQAAPVGLVAVGMAAAMGTVFGLRQRIVRYRAAALMGGAGMLMAPLGVFLAQQLPNRPLLAAFALVLTYTAWRMLRRPALAVPHPATIPCHVDDADQRRLGRVPVPVRWRAPDWCPVCSADYSAWVVVSSLFRR